MRIIRSLLQNERGFTLLESLFQLVVFILFASISVLIMLWFRDIQSLDKTKDDVNWELFVYDLNQYNERSKTGELLDAKRLRMEFHNDEEGRYFIFGKSDNHLRKTTNKGGNEIMLPEVYDWTLTQSDYDILVKVVMKDGTVRETKLVRPIAPQ